MWQVVGREMLARLIQYLCANAQTDGVVMQLLQTTDIHILPALNPDGYVSHLPANQTTALSCLLFIGYCACLLNQWP